MVTVVFYIFSVALIFLKENDYPQFVAERRSLG